MRTYGELSGRGAFMWFVVADRLEGPALSVDLWRDLWYVCMFRRTIGGNYCYHVQSMPIVDVEGVVDSVGKCLQVCTASNPSRRQTSQWMAAEPQLLWFTEFKCLYVTKSVLFRFKYFVACKHSELKCYHELFFTNVRIEVIFVSASPNQWQSVSSQQYHCSAASYVIT